MPAPVAIVAALFVAAAGLVVGGVYLLVGMPWALIATGLLLFGAAVHLRSRLKPNG